MWLQQSYFVEVILLFCCLQQSYFVELTVFSFITEKQENSNFENTPVEMLLYGSIVVFHQSNPPSLNKQGIKEGIANETDTHSCWLSSLHLLNSFR